MTLDFCPFVELRKFAKERVGHDKAEDGVAEKFERFVVDHAAAHVLVGSRRVGHRMLEEPAVAETVVDRLLQGVELVADPHDLPVGQLRHRSVCLDNPFRLVGVVFVHRNAHFAETVSP